MLPKSPVDQVVHQGADAMIELGCDVALRAEGVAVLVPGAAALVLHAHERYAMLDQAACEQQVLALLREGQRVEFTPEDSGKGPRAGDVRLIEG